MWTPDEIQQARNNLSGYSVYKALLEATTPMWGAKELAEFLDHTGIRPRASKEQVITWCSSRTVEGQPVFPGAVRYEGNVGWRIPLEDVICFFGLGIVNQVHSATG